MSVTAVPAVPALIPIVGSSDAAKDVVQAIVDLKQLARAQVGQFRSAHNQEMATAQRQAEADRAALQAAHEKTIADMSTKHAAEIEKLQGELAVARKAAAEVSRLRERMYSCAHASHLLAAAVKPD
jgi:Skp family chaperone for outer membrane proteins